MSTRLRRPSLWRQLFVSAALFSFQGYLGLSAVVGKFGIEGRKLMQADIDKLKVTSGGLSAEIDSYRHKISLFDSKSLDPDILTEKARAMLLMAQVGDMVVMIDPNTRKPDGGSQSTSTENQAMPKIESGID